MNSTPSFKKLYFKDTSFANLMTKRIYNILLIASKYDAFTLEDDGRVDEQIFNEYVSLNLRYPPRFTQVSTGEEALKELEINNYELIICMPGDKKDNNFEIAKTIKARHQDIPIVVLTPFSREVSKYMATADLSAIDYVFSWLGNTDLLLAIIKLIEDKMNVDQDIDSVGVRVILLVEDSVRFYSSILPNLYKFVLEQSRNFATEALNGHQQMLRMRGRPKILLARNYEEAKYLYRKHRDNMLGVISDMSFDRGGLKDKEAGIRFCRKVRNTDAVLPIILNSSDCSNRKYAEELGVGYIDKASKTFPQELRQLLTDTFGFGDFVFRNPDTGEEIVRIKNLKDLQEQIFTIPDDSLRYHLSRNQASRWLYSRAMFPLAKFIENVPIQDYENTIEARKIIFEAIVMYRRTKNRGVIAEFKRDRFDKYSNFVRLGEGSLGGKGRGLAFIDGLIKRNVELSDYDGVNVCIPKTLVLCTEIFDQFMENNGLYQIALSDAADEEILDVFVNSHLPDGFNDNLRAFLAVVQKPIAIRSSSLLEDAHYQPFAGIYSTYMIPWNEDIEKTLSLLKKSIKGVYASVFFQNSKAYMTATSNVIDQEKMAIILEEVCGTTYGDRYYPTFSGVARSLNYYPIGHETAEDGIANVALGLGKYIVDGGITLRFSPKHQHSILQMSSLDFALRETQTHFLCLDLNNKDFQLSTDDGQNLTKVNVQDAEKDGTLSQIASTYDHMDNVLREGLWGTGRKIISFAHILQNDTFPLAKILERVLALGQKEMGRPVEIEFAVELSPDESGNSTFYLLQIRPIVDTQEMLEEDIEAIPREQTILKTRNALGHGIDNDVYDLVYIKPESFQASKNQLTAYEVDKINRQLTQEGRGYILMGPGRWGSSDTWLGIPVKWPNIASARLIVETGLTNYQIDPSQGTHFFQNLTSFGVSYYTIPYGSAEDFCDMEFLNKQPALYENDYFRHIRFEKPIVIKTDGKKNRGVVLKP
ncbi:MAG: PEP/pyruvate-binding domain-containing protein [Bacteroidales bacterium]|nr:PEP/pyruvate-binding domain-containing protein [Bacteroidales bacterium]